MALTSHRNDAAQDYVRLCLSSLGFFCIWDAYVGITVEMELTEEGGRKGRRQFESRT